MQINDGDLLTSSNEQTSQRYDKSKSSVTTTFDSDKFSKTTDISVVTVILHESVHAYLISYFNISPFEAKETYSELFDDIVKDKYPNQNDAQHAEFVRYFVNDIGNALSEYGSKQGYKISDQYYNEIAWGGLTSWRMRNSNGRPMTDSDGKIIYEDTPWFKDKYPDLNNRNRIKNEILTEHGYKNAKNQKGKKSGC